MSAAERFEQVKDRLTPDLQGLLLSTIVTASGAPADQVAFTEILRWWALSGYDPEAYMAYVIKWKLKCGQTGLSLRIFHDALASGSLSYRFSTLVKRVDQSRGQVTVTTSDGSQHVGSYLVCTIPLNTLNDVAFNPPLSRSKVLAATKGQINLCVKAHAEVAGTDQRSWWGIAYNKRPGIMAGAFGDGLTPAGNTHLVSFSLNGAFQNAADRGFAEIKAAYEEFKAVEIKRLVSFRGTVLSSPIRRHVRGTALTFHKLYHPWATDPLAKGTWAMYAPGFATRFKRDLQTSQGRVHFASADWADGWHGFIDGAIEQGIRAASKICTDLQKIPSARL